MAIRAVCALSVLAAAVSSQSDLDPEIRNRRCLDQDAELKTAIGSTALRVALYSGELSKCSDSKQTGLHLHHCTNSKTDTGYQWPEISQADNKDLEIWSGYDITLLDELSEVGNFTYTIINMGRNTNISALQHVDGGYTAMARMVLGVDAGGPDIPADLAGQSTWRINEERLEWALWSVPMVTEVVELLALKETLKEETFESRIMIVFSPFESGVWLALVILAILYTSTMLTMVDRHKETINEISHADVAYDTCLTMFGGGMMDHQKHQTKSISIGWIVFSVLIFEIYFANLTAILSQPPEVVSGITGMQDVRNGAKPFCVHKNAANDEYFTTDPEFGNADENNSNTSELNIVRKDSVPLQIDGLIDGSCAASEITREDFFLWVANNNRKDDYCRLAFIGQPITTRHRGMLATRNGSCVLAAINVVYHALGVRKCKGQRKAELCTARSILEEHFPQPNCDGWSNPALSVTEGKGLGLIDLFGPFMLLLILWFLGIVTGRLALYHPELPGLSWWTLSTTARDIRAGQMLRRTREAAAWHQREALRSKLKVGALAVLATAKTKTSTSGSRRHTVNGPPDARIVAEDADASTGSPKNKVWPSDAGNQNTQHCIP